MSNNIEIERRFLLKDSSWKEERFKSVEKITQGYLTNKDCKSTARVRLIDGVGYSEKYAFLSVKGPKRENGGRLELENSLDVITATQMINEMCNTQITKIRTKIQYYPNSMGWYWEIDEFLGKNSGLVIAEIELPRLDVELVLPPWIGKEITNDKEYSNYRLSLKE